MQPEAEKLWWTRFEMRRTSRLYACSPSVMNKLPLANGIVRFKTAVIDFRASLLAFIPTTTDTTESGTLLE